jgi:hypothetical protein
MLTVCSDATSLSDPNDACNDSPPQRCFVSNTGPVGSTSRIDLRLFSLTSFHQNTIVQLEIRGTMNKTKASKATLIKPQP